MINLDLAIINVKIADLSSLKVFTGWLGIKNGKFIYSEEGAAPQSLNAKKIIDKRGYYIIPGLVDSHMHIESSLLTPERFEEAALPKGTTTILNDPHEVANVSGIEGIKWFMKRAEKLKLRVYHSIPSCVPASSPELEWTAFRFGGKEVEILAEEENVLALGEVMDYKRVLSEDRVLKSMVDTALVRGLRVEGHIPTLNGNELSEYLAWGITSDHTLMNPKRIIERISRGVFVMLQLKSITEENIKTIMQLKDRSSVLLVTDDIEPSMLKKGHLSTIVKEAVQKGMNKLEALASASIRPARYLNLKDIGLIAPGYKADFLLMKDLLDFPPDEVYIGGKIAAKKGVLLNSSLIIKESKINFTIPPPVSKSQLKLKTGKNENGKILLSAVVVENNENSLTGLEKLSLELVNGFPDFKKRNDISLVCVFARNGKAKNLGIVKNLGLKYGAYASTFEHDSHNLMIVGRDIDDMVTASKVVYKMEGGIAVVKNGSCMAKLPLPVLGILSDHHYREVADNLASVENSLKNLGMTHKRPFLLLSVLCLSVSPYFKFTDKGIVDTENRMLLKKYE